MGFSTSKEHGVDHASSQEERTESDHFPDPGDLEFELPPSKRPRFQSLSASNNPIREQVTGAPGEQLSQDSILPAAEPATDIQQLVKQNPPSQSIDEPQIVTEADPAHSAFVNWKREVKRGEAQIKPEYLLPHTTINLSYRDDDEAEASKPPTDQRQGPNPQSRTGGEYKKKERGQNKGRKYGAWGDFLTLCDSRALKDEFSPGECYRQDKCKHEHDLRKYLEHGRAEDLATFHGICPVFAAHGFCPAGWKCRFHSSHSKEIEHEDGRKELVLVVDDGKAAATSSTSRKEESDLYNVVSREDQIKLNRSRVDLPKSEAYLAWLQKVSTAEMDKNHNVKVNELSEKEKAVADRWASVIKPQSSEETSSNGLESNTEQQDHRAAHIEPPLRPSEKRRLYYGPETPVLAPLTTQGNLPFRRLCASLGAQATFSEMALGKCLVNGEKNEWALMKAHRTEIEPPKVSEDAAHVLPGYDNTKDLRYGVQIAAGKPWMAIKATEVLTRYCPHLRCIDLNAGCPIDLVYKSGAGSALLDAPSRLEKILRGMNIVSGDIPITVKLRTGTKDNKPTALSNAERLIMGSQHSEEYGLRGCGIAAITLHGRSRQQRYTRQADWSYIAEVSAMIHRLRERMAEQTDTATEVDDRNLPNGGKVWFVGNGDCYSHQDYFTQLKDSRVDTIMIGRGALIKPWIFEEIATEQYLDKSSSERLEYIKDFVKYGLDCWGSDEIGVGRTRRFLLEWLSFTCRYIPLGLLERLPPKLNERPPPYRGRDDLETLLASTNYRDWIKISEMFLGKPHEGFRFVPKHKSNAIEINAFEAEG